MWRKLVLVLAALGLIGLGVFWFLTIPASISASSLAAYSPDLENGKRMFLAGGCTSCHVTPNQNEPMRLGGGFALNSPFGVFYVPNISSDRRDGIGGWNEAQFVTAMTKGTSPDGRHYYPAFPYTSYHRIRIDDLRDLFAFLRTLPPVSGKVRDHDLPFPFNIRRGVGAWKLLFLSDEMFEPDPKQSAEWNRGAYLVNGPGHCAECHSPRNLLGAIKTSQRFAGGPNPEGEGWIPNITQHGLQDWEADDFAVFFETGRKPDGDSAGGRMAAVIRSISQLPAADREAMALYLKTLPPVEGPKRPGRR
jgi:mono/diheme cytochrome c family protein